MTTHIGQRIRAELDRQGHTVTWLARQINCDRRNVYDIFRRATLDTQLLYTVSIALRHDFFSELSASLRDDLRHQQKNDLLL